MTIHHDKSVYGKMASLTEEFSEERLLEMVNSLKEEGKKEKGSEKQKKKEKKQRNAK